MRHWRMHLKRHFAPLFGLWCAVYLSGCAPLNGLFAPAPRLSKAAIVLNVPYHKQTSEDLCGLAVAKMLTDYYHLPLTTLGHKQLLQEAQKTAGISGASLEVALQKAGYFVAVFEGSLNHKVTGLYYHLDRHRPLIVMYLHKGDVLGHYVIVTGYDPIQNLLVVLDPAAGREVMRAGQFLAQWKRSGQFTLLAMPKPKTKR